jgi:hypothetical protein
MYNFVTPFSPGRRGQGGRGKSLWRRIWGEVDHKCKGEEARKYGEGLGERLISNG